MKKISRTFRAAGHYNVKVSGIRRRGPKKVYLQVSTRRGRPLTRLSDDYLYFYVPPAEARRMLATLQELLQ